MVSYQPGDSGTCGKFMDAYMCNDLVVLHGKLVHKGHRFGSQVVSEIAYCYPIGSSGFIMWFCMRKVQVSK